MPLETWTETLELEKTRHKMIYEITERMESFHMNTVVSAFMEFTNKLQDFSRNKGGVDKATLETLTVLLAPFAPHMAEELWGTLGNEGSVFAQTWPVYDKEKMKDDTINMAVQVNGKVKGKIDIGADEAKESVLEKAKAAVTKQIEGKNVVKEIYVPGRIINIVVK